MTAVESAGAQTEEIPALDFDAIIIGAGMSGMYQLYRLRELGLRVRVLEAGPASVGPGIGTAIPEHALISKRPSLTVSIRKPG